MTSVKDKTDKLAEYIDEAKSSASTCFRPTSTSRWSTSPSSASAFASGWRRSRASAKVRCAASSTRATTAARFADLFDLAKRVDAKHVNRRVFEALVKCGALDALPGNRAQKLAALDAAFELAAHATRDARTRSGLALRRSAARTRRRSSRNCPCVPAPSTREMLGVGEGDARRSSSRAIRSPTSQHVLDARGRDARSRICATSNDEMPVTVAGIVTSVRRTMTKSGQQMLIAQLEDTTGVCEVIVFAKIYPSRCSAVRGRRNA